MKQNKFLNKQQEVLIHQWWQAMQPSADHDKDYHSNFNNLGRGDRALLCRCKSPDAVLLQPAFHQLAQPLMALEEQKEKPFDKFSNDPTAYALVAGLLTHVRADDPHSVSIAQALGKKKNDKPLMSGIRFARLYDCSQEADFYLLIIRAIQLLGKKAHILNLADDILAWVWECRDGHAVPSKFKLKTRWAGEYFQANIENPFKSETI